MAVALIAALVSAQRRRRVTLEIRSSVADSLGLDYQHAWGEPDRLVGTRHGHRVAVEFLEGKAPSTTVRVRGVIGSALIEKETLGSRVAKIIVGNDIETGDAAFDEELLVRGPEAKMRAVLTSEARRQVRSVVTGWGARVEGGDITATLRGTNHDARTIRALVSSLVDAARALEEPEDVPGALARNAAADTSPVARLHCLRLLASEWPDLTRTREAIVAALEDPDPRVALAAARGAGERGWAVAHRIALDRRAPEELRIEALHLRDDAAPAELVAATAKALLDDPRAQVAAAAVRVSGRRRLRGVAPLIDRLAERLDDELRLAVAEALGKLGLSTSEDALLELLGSEEPRVKTAAALGLGRCGSVRAVEPLLLAAKTVGLLGPGDLKQAVEDSVKRIQARLSGASAGQLSLAAVESGGELSIAEEPGALSLADPKIPQKG